MRPIFNKAPLTPNTLSPLPVGSIRPEGWLKDTLTAQLKGVMTSFAAICPELTSDGSWRVAADGDCTRSLYYLEAAVALGWALDDEALKAQAKRMAEGILSSKHESGWFGPGENDDYWPRMLALRALRLYFGATNDVRVLKLMDGFFKYEYRSLQSNPLREYAVARGAENMEAALWLYDLTGQKYLLDLCRRLREQTLDWTNYLHSFPCTQPMNKSLRWERLSEALVEERNEPLVGEKRPYFHREFHFTNGVNLAFGMKTPGVINQFKSGFKEEGGFRFGWEKVVKYHGVAGGMYNCDNHLNGGNPTQGVSVMALIEMMNSLETLIAVGNGGQEAMDLLEKLAYNALPAAFDADMSRLQRLQQTNQICLSAQARRWYNEGDDANLYLPVRNDLPAAMSLQGWPKFLSSMWYATEDGGLAAVSYAPCTVRFTAGDTPVRVKVTGGYPFTEHIEIAVTVKKSAEFPLYLRIPFWARQAMITLPDGEIMQLPAGEVSCVRRQWSGTQMLRLSLPAAPRITRWYHQSGSVEVGPLLMCLKLEPERPDAPDGATVQSQEPWNFALVRDEPMKLIRIEEDVSAFKKGESAVGVMVRTARVDWPADGGSSGSLPMAPRFGREALDIVELVPYGDAKLRISEFPIGEVREKKQKEVK